MPDIEEAEVVPEAAPQPEAQEDEQSVEQVLEMLGHVPGTGAMDNLQAPQLSEFIAAVCDKIPLKEMGGIIATEILTGKDKKTRRDAIMTFLDALKAQTKLMGETSSKDEIEKMTDEQIRAVFKDEFGYLTLEEEPRLPHGQCPKEIKHRKAWRKRYRLKLYAKLRELDEEDEKERAAAVAKY